MTVRTPTRASSDPLKHHHAHQEPVAWGQAFIVAGIIYVAGLACNVGARVYGSIATWIFLATVPTAVGALVTWRVWIMARPRTADQRQDLTGAVAAAACGFVITVLAATWWPWTFVYAVGSVGVIVVLNLRMTRWVRGVGDDKHTTVGITPEQVGLAAGTRTRVVQGEIVIDHADGETVDDTRTALSKLGSQLKLRPGSLVANPGDHMGQSRVKVIDPTVLDKPVPFTPPIPPTTAADALSVVDPIDMGTYADGTRFARRLDVHALVMGCTGSGKSLGEQLLATNLLTRRDVCVLWCDPIAGAMSAGPIADALTWATDGQDADQRLASAKAMIAGINRAVTARITHLGTLTDSHGEKFTKWTPEAWTLHRVPYLVVFCDEAEWLVDHAKFTEIVEQARKAGISMRAALPRAQHARMDTNVRAQLTERICYGVLDEGDTALVLPTHIIEAGACPHTWGKRHPGRFIAVVDSAPEDHLAVPILGDMPTIDGHTVAPSVMRDVVRAHAHVRAQLDQVTANAFGPAYAAWVQAHGGTDPAVPTTPPSTQLGTTPTDDDYDDDEETEPMPTPPDGVTLTGVDPHNDRDSRPQAADDVNLAGFGESKLSTEQRNEMFRQMLADAWGSGRTRVNQNDLSKAWAEIPGGGGRPWTYMRLKRLADQTHDGHPCVTIDNQDPQWWEINSDPLQWPTGVVAATGAPSDVD